MFCLLPCTCIRIQIETLKPLNLFKDGIRYDIIGRKYYLWKEIRDCYEKERGGAFGQTDKQWNQLRFKISSFPNISSFICT